MKAKVTLALKTMGMNLKDINRKDLTYTTQATWDRSSHTFVFFEYDEYLKLEKTVQFKNTVQHCKVHNFKYIIFSSLVKEVVEKDGYRILPYSKVQELMKDYMIAIAS